MWERDYQRQKKNQLAYMRQVVYAKPKDYLDPLHLKSNQLQLASNNIKVVRELKRMSTLNNPNNDKILRRYQSEDSLIEDDSITYDKNDSLQNYVGSSTFDEVSKLDDNHICMLSEKFQEQKNDLILELCCVESFNACDLQKEKSTPLFERNVVTFDSEFELIVASESQGKPNIDCKV